MWAKLDAGEESLYDTVNRSRVPLERVLKNILACGRARPIVIQSLWMRVHGKPPTPEQIDAFASRLEELERGGCQIREVHVYTIARQTVEHWVDPLDQGELDAVKNVIADRLPSLSISSFV